MGIGDWLMASGEAYDRFLMTGRKTLFRHPRGHVIREAVFDGNPAIAYEPGPDVDEVVEGGGVRPYIEMKTPDRWVWKNYSPKPAPLLYDECLVSRYVSAMTACGVPHVLLAPTSKVISHRNKEWPAGYWAELASAISRSGLCAHKIEPIGGTEFRCVDLGGRVAATHKIPDFKNLIAALRAAKLLNAVLVTHEGGTHHAAAAVGMKAIVLYGGFISPNQTGYGFHRNLHTTGEPCGSRIDCYHCAAAMNSIRPIDVLADIMMAVMNPLAAVPWIGTKP